MSTSTLCPLPPPPPPGVVLPIPIWAKIFWLAVFLAGGWILHAVASGKISFFVVAAVIISVAAFTLMIMLSFFLKDASEGNPDV